MAQQIRQNYHEQCEALVNKQINMELYTSYVYIALASYFNRVDQALPGFASFFWKSSNVEFNHGGALIEYQAKRGGKVVLQDINKPTRMEWGTPLEAMTAVLEMQKTVTCTLQDLQAVAAEKKDFHLVDFIQKQLVEKKVATIKQIGDCLTKIKRAGDGAGLYIVDKELQQAVVTCSLQQLQTVVKNTVNCNLTNLTQQGIQGNQGEVIKEITDCLTAIKMA